MFASRTIRLILVVMLMCVGASDARLVDLSPDEAGDRIAVVRDGQVTYLPAKRVDLGKNAVGGGICRYIKRAKNDDLYIMGTGLGSVLRSTDGGHHWTSTPLKIENMGFLSAFTILADDTFLIACTRGYEEMYAARSTDYGSTWETYAIEVELSPHKIIGGWNADLLELDDGTILLTAGLRSSPDTIHDESGNPLPIQLQGSFPYVVFSRDGGRTWPEKAMITMYGAETHLLQLPSGKLLAAIRKQRGHRLPGDPVSPMEMKLQYGYRPQFPSEESESQYRERTSRIKNMFLSESYDQGYTWVNERQVSSFLQCSGDLTLTTDGVLLMAFHHRYADDIGGDGVRMMISYDEGKTWENDSYIIGQGTVQFDTAVCYPSSIAMADGALITVCANHVGGEVARLEAVHWRPLPKESRE